MKMCLRWLYASMRIAQNVNDSRKKALFTAASPSIVIVKSVAIHSSLCITLMPHRKFFLDAASLVMQCQKLDKRPLVLLIFVHFTLLGKMV